MTRATLRQRLFGLSRKDLSRLSLTEQEAIAAALAEIDPARSSADYPDARARPFVHRGDIAWCVYLTRPVKSATTFAYVDDEKSEVLHVHRWGRGLGGTAPSIRRDVAGGGREESNEGRGGPAPE